MTHPQLLTPIYGESVYSILSRIHTLEVNTSPFVTLKRWMGIRGYKPLSGMPTHLESFANKLSMPEGALRIINAHTHFPLYEHFLSEERRALLITAMLYEGAPKSRLGLLRNDMGARDKRRYCSLCVNSDIERYGVALWRREHTLPGFMVCPEHGDTLFELQTTNKYGERQLVLPGGGNKLKTTGNVDVEEKLHYIARQVKILMVRPKATFISTNVYRRLLLERNLITKNGCVRQKKLLCTVTEWLAELKSLEGFDKLFVGLKFERSWLAELVAGDDGFHHPIKHIILWGSLGIDANEVLNSATSFGEQLELPLSDSKPINLTKDLIEETLLITGSLRKASKVIGVDITTLIVALDSYEIPRKRRPKKITLEMRAAIIESLNNTSSRILANRYDISIASVNRIRRSVRPKDEENYKFDM